MSSPGFASLGFTVSGTLAGDCQVDDSLGTSGKRRKNRNKRGKKTIDFSRISPEFNVIINIMTYHSLLST